MDVEDGRHFRNVMDDNHPPADWEAKLLRAITDGTVDLLQASHSKGSVYTGAAGVAYVLLDLATSGLHEDPPAACREALRRLEEAEAACDPRRVTLLEGQAGCVALKAWAHNVLEQHALEEQCIRRLSQLADRATALPDGECEVLYGRCGFLGAVLLVRQRLEDPRLLAAPAAELVRQVITTGQRQARDGWPLYYEWHEKCYLGAAHGIAGILHTLLQLPAELALAGSDAANLVRTTAEKLMDCRFRSGNLPSSLGNSKDRLVQFCHGATGMVSLALRLSTDSKDSHHKELAQQFGQTVWIRGLLRKGLGLCHGIPGNGFALLKLHPGELWLNRALHFAVFAIEHKDDLLPEADRPYSLFEGLAGAVCFWVAALKAARGSSVNFPCYDSCDGNEQNHLLSFR